MNRNLLIRLSAPLLVGGWLLAAVGCGEKIAIPQPDGLYSVSSYSFYDFLDVADPRQVATDQGVVFLLAGSRLSKHDLSFGIIDTLAGLSDPRALCLDEDGQTIFVWEDGAERLSWYGRDGLVPLGSLVLPGNGEVVAMVINADGIEQVPGGRTFLYLAVPDEGVVRRYIVDQYGSVGPYGILTRSDGDGARFVHRAAGMATSFHGRLLACDTDPARNWIINFNAEPDTFDVAASPDDDDPLRGIAALFRAPVCNPPSASEYVLGDAPGCGETDWVGGPSDAEGEFDHPGAVAVDGSGRIFVADTGNDRVQIFSADGEYDYEFGKTTVSPGPVSIALVDYKFDTGVADYDFAAWVYVVVPSTNQVRRFISSEHFQRISEGPPPID